MEAFIDREMVSLQAIEERVNGHKAWLMSKKRTRYSFEELVMLKLKELRQRVFKQIVDCDQWEKREAYFKGIGKYEYIDADWKVIKVGEKWGGHDVSCFFRKKIILPEVLEGEKVALQIFLGGDSLVYINGVPFHGLDPFRNSILLTKCAKAGDVFDIFIESYCYHTPGAEGDGVRKLECSYITAIDDDYEDTYWDYVVVYNSLFIPQLDEKTRGYLAEMLRQAYLCIDTDEKDEKIFRAKLEEGRRLLLEKVYECTNLSLSGKVHLVGHSHLDIVYLWPYKEFVRKIGRTHATMLRLLEEFPNFKFSQSQALLYKEMKQHFPELFEQVKQRVKEGRWEAIGAMWVEPDCNLISGESFVRQILVGSRFFQKELGVKPRTCWLPDVFGECYTMPQILAKSGIDFFVTHKPCVWNDKNPWSQHSFWWEGPDGSKVFAALSPTHFVGTAEPNHIMDNWNRFSDRDTVGESLYCYGWGDGGGGVSPDMLQNATRLGKFPGMPETQMINAEDALESMRNNANGLPVLKDEIYLEAHRGVYTTKGKLKKLNRYSENLYREAELYSSIANQMGLEYPCEKLNEGWEKILTNQFHDILPGTQVEEGYKDVLLTYDNAINSGESVRKDALATICKLIGTKTEKGLPFAVFNSLAYCSTQMATIAPSMIAEYASGSFILEDCEGNEVDWQLVSDVGSKSRIVFAAENIPAVGYKVYYLKKGKQKLSGKEKFKVSKECLENRFFCITFSEGGEITSIYDKTADREILNQGGKGNVFKLYGDIPSKYDAWDVIYEYKDNEIHLEAGTIEVCDHNEVLASVVLTKKISNSVLKQKIIVYDKIDRIDFETEVDWKEHKKLLKVGFEVDIAAKSFTSDIAYGTIERTNYRFNSYETAKFETSAHNWIDLSDEDYGVSILNDCKYGFDVTERTMSISLLKSPVNPDPTSDMEVHYFNYAIYAHTGNWKRAETMRKGLEFNNQPQSVLLEQGAGKLPESFSFIGVNHSNVSLEALKKAEDGDGIIVRVVERCGISCNTQLNFFKEISSAVECDLMEQQTALADYQGNVLKFRMKPYEIKTFCVKFLCS